MTIEEQNKLLIRRYYQEVVNTGNVERIPDFISSEFAESYNGVRNKIGIAGAEAHIVGVRETFSDLTIFVERQIAEGEWVVSQGIVRGVHTGKWMEMNPTGKAVEISVVNVDRIIDGKIVEHGGAANMLESLLHIGAVKVVGDGRN